MRLRVGLGILALAAVAAWAQPAPPAPPTPPRAPTRGRVYTVAPPAESGYLGIGVAEITPERAKALNLKEVRGAEVTSVTPDSPAAKAGLKENDVVLEYNGQAIQGTAQLERLVRETPPDRQVRIVVWRNGGMQTLTATTGTKNEAMVLGPGRVFTMPDIRIPNFQMPDMPQMQMNWRNPRLGILGEALGQEDQFAEFFGVKQGVLVKSVLKNSAAEKAGIRVGDVIVKVGDTKVNTTEEITRVLRGLRDAKSTVTLTVVRNKKEIPITVTIENPNSGAVRAAARMVRVQDRINAKVNAKINAAIDKRIRVAVSRAAVI